MTQILDLAKSRCTSGWKNLTDVIYSKILFDTMISDGIIVDARAEQTMKQNTWFTRTKLRNHDLGKYFLPCSQREKTDCVNMI